MDTWDWASMSRRKICPAMERNIITLTKGEILLLWRLYTSNKGWLSFPMKFGGYMRCNDRVVELPGLHAPFFGKIFALWCNSVLQLLHWKSSESSACNMSVLLLKFSITCPVMYYLNVSSSFMFEYLAKSPSVKC